MTSVELKVSLKDWLFIIVVAAFFGFFISWFFFFIDKELKELSTIVFCMATSITIAIFSSILISISNKYLLPKINEKFWYFISFVFSFFAGTFGFLSSFIFFKFFEINIVKIIEPFGFYISITIGFLTFLIGMILHKFISMKYKNEEIKREILENKIKALENELNPHFLFNALNSVSELIYIDKKEAEKAVIDISKFLRNAISKDSLIPLEVEINMVKTYVNIENIRFDNKIVVDFNIDDEIKFDLVPKFSIQLLVENAIKHGYNGKVLNVNISTKENEIIVKNSGKKAKNIVYGTGLTNLSRRLKLLEVGELSVNKEEDVSFSIKLKD